MDITYIPMARGFVYLAVVLDWFRDAWGNRTSSRRLLASGSLNWRGMASATQINFVSKP
jgi:hypothetical protein